MYKEATLNLKAPRTENITFKHIKMRVSEEINRYAHLTFPVVKAQQLLSKNIREAIYSVALEKKQVAALAISVRQPKGRIKMISFYVKDHYRNQGIGTALIQNVIHVCSTSTNKTLQLSYKTFWDHNTYWEQLLRNTNWNVESTDNLYIKLENGQDLKHIPILQESKLPVEFAISHLNQQRLQQLIGWTQLTSQLQIPPDVHPAKNLSELNESCSLLLTINGEIAGWIIGQQIDPYNLQISSLFIIPKYRNHHEHIGLKLIAEAVMRNNHVGTTFFGMRRRNKFMKEFLKHIQGTYTLFEKKKASITIN